MRLRNVSNSNEIINNSKYIIENPNEYKGRYKELFGNNNPIHIEIGTGKGNFIIGMSKMYPDINFIGIEKYDSVICRACEKLEELELPNLKLIRIDARLVEDILCKEVECIYLNFSDPWPKNRHESKRLSSANFLAKYDNLFIENKHIIMKSDNRNLMEFSIKSFTDYGYKINKISLDLHNDDLTGNVETEYEAKFVAKGNPIYMVDVYK